MKKNWFFLLFVVLFVVIGTCLSTIGAVEPEPDLQIVACNLSFQDSIYVKYAVKGNDLSGVKLLIWKTPQTEYYYGSQDYIINSSGSETVSGNTCSIFIFDKYVAKQMTDVIYARAMLSRSDGVYYSDVKKYSVLQYAYNKIGKTGSMSNNSNLILLLNDMLEYGSRAQTYLNYKTDRLATMDFYQVKVEGGVLEDMCDIGLYLPGETVSLTAPTVNEAGMPFACWQNSQETIVATTEVFEVSIGESNEKYYARYGNISDYYFKTVGHEDNTCEIVGLNKHDLLIVDIPEYMPNGDRVVGISENAFLNEGLAEIKIPDSVLRIEDGAFEGCTNLTKVDYKGSFNSWLSIVFDGFTSNPCCNGASLYIDNSLLIRAAIPEGITKINSYAFCGCISLNILNVPDGLEEIGDYFLAECSELMIANIPNSITSIGDGSFKGCTKLTVLTLPDILERIGNEAFSDCSSLTSIQIPDSVTFIGDKAFYNCTGISEINIPAGITHLGDYIFNGCDNLTKINYAGAKNTWKELVLKGYLEIKPIPNIAVYCSDGSFSGHYDYFTVGETYKFGKYEQDNDLNNGKEEIEWLLLSKSGNRLLVISKYALDAMPYNSPYGITTWGSSSLRAWLNGEFANTAFNEQEMNMIAVTTQTTAPETTAVSDKVFVITVSSAKQYFTTSNQRKCQPTEYAKARGAFTGSLSTCCWWLRTLIKFEGGNECYQAAAVFRNGDVNGDNSNDQSFYVSHNAVGIRPSMYISFG